MDTGLCVYPISPPIFGKDQSELIPTKDDYQILLLEDDKNQAQMISEFLQLAGSYYVDRADSLQEFWKLLKKNEYDVLLLDYKLPDGTGLDALIDLPDHGYNIPVIMITGQGDERVAAQSIQRGAFDYVVKGSDYLLTLPSKIEKTFSNHQMQLSIQRSMQHIRYQALLLNNVREAVVVWDLENHITYWNPAAQSLFGWSPQERLGHLVDECYLSIFIPKVDLPFDEETHKFEVERKCQTKDGREIWVSSRLATLRDDSSEVNIIGYIDVVRDITERKIMQALFQSAQTNLTQAARLTAIGELASGVAHQISNPLTTVIADTQILLSKLALDHPAHESALAIEKAGWRLQEAVQRLYDFSRPAPDTLKLIDVNETLERAIALVGKNIIGSGVNLEVSLGEEIPKITSNVRQLEDLWVNLLLVSRDATEEGRSHSIRVCSKTGVKNAVIVEICDDGKLIPPEQLSTIFEPNFTGQNRCRGSGMELSICREIVRQHAGKITAKSNRDHGTIFRVALPYDSDK